MIDTMLANLDTLLLYVFAACALVGAALMIVLREPMRVALALISTMVFLGGIYGLLGVHFIAAFQVLIYVGAVMVFMVYVIMLLDPRDPSSTRRYSRFAVPAILGFAVLLGALLAAFLLSAQSGAGATPADVSGFTLQRFSAAFVGEYWLQFELTSVLLVAAVVAALAVIRVSRRGRG